MPKLEQFELEAHRGEIVRDVRHLVEKYRAVFDWDVPDIDQAAADRLILTEAVTAVNALKDELLNAG